MKKPSVRKRDNYARWNNMKSRCYNSKSISYRWYGAKGITVCDEWKNDYFAFEAWILSQPNYSRDMVLTRHGDKGNYEPSNCVLKTMSENSKETKHLITAAKKILCVETGKVYKSATHAAKEIGLSQCLVAQAANPNDRHKSAGGYTWRYIEGGHTHVTNQ